MSLLTGYVQIYIDAAISKHNFNCERRCSQAGKEEHPPKARKHYSRDEMLIRSSLLLRCEKKSLSITYWSTAVTTGFDLSASILWKPGS